MKTTNCVYRNTPVDLGRARHRCPACGATLQNHDPRGLHYIMPPGPARAAKRGPAYIDTSLPAMLGEPEPLL